MDVADYPDHLFYDMHNQIWYEPLADGTVRAGFTPWAATRKRIGREFEKERSFAVVEGGKWVGSARAAFHGVVIAHNERLIREPGLLSEDAFGTGWMLVVRPARADWRDGLVSGQAIGPAFAAWLATGAYKDRAD